MATNPYTSQSVGSYNTAPPSDDGAQTEANRITWSGVKTKLADVILTLTQSINSAALAAFGKTVNTDLNESNSIGGSLAFTESTLTVSANSITPTRTAHAVAASGGVSDIITTIGTGSVADGCWLLLRRNQSGTTITLKHGLGNISLSGQTDYVLVNDYDFVMLRLYNGSWYQIGGNYLVPPSSTGASPQQTFYAPIVGINRAQAIIGI